MSTETPYNPYAVFENMADEDVVLKAKQEDNALAQEYLLHKYRNFVRAKARSYFLIWRRTRGYHSGRNDRPL